jgi:hypothetical protein
MSGIVAEYLGHFALPRVLVFPHSHAAAFPESDGTYDIPLKREIHSTQ